MVLTKISDAAVIVSRVENNKIEKLAHLEGSPNAQTIIKISLSVDVDIVFVSVLFRVCATCIGSSLPDRHPLEIRSHSMDLSCINRNAGARLEERIFRVVQPDKPVPVPVVGKLCVHDCPLDTAT